MAVNTPGPDDARENTARQDTSTTVSLPLSPSPSGNLTASSPTDLPSLALRLLPQNTKKVEKAKNTMFSF